MDVSNNQMYYKNNNIILLIFVNNNAFKKKLMIIWGILGIFILGDELSIIWLSSKIILLLS